MPRQSKRPAAAPGLNVWLLRHDRGWRLDDLGAAIRRATGKTYSRSALSRLEQQNQYSPESIAHVAAGFGVPLFALFADERDVLYYDLTPEGQQRVADYIRDLTAKYRR